MKISISLFVFLFVSFSHAVQCFTEKDRDEARLVLDLAKKRNVWPGFEKFNLIYAFTSKNTILVGIKSESQNLEACSDFPDAFLFSGNVLKPENGLYDIRLIGQPAKDDLSHFIEEFHQPLVQIKLENDFNFPSKSVARISLHESFHGIFQFSSGLFVIKDTKPRDFFQNCLQVKKWKDSVLRQNKILSETLGGHDQGEARVALERIRHERDLLLGEPDSKDCVEAQRFWERLEGSAHYVETEAALNLDLLSEEEFRKEMHVGLQELNDGFFYFTGDALIRLAIIANSNAKQLINEGATIELLPIAL